MAAHSSILAWTIPIDSGVWQATVHGITKSGTRLSDSTFYWFHWDLESPLEITDVSVLMETDPEFKQNLHAKSPVIV